MGRYRVGVIFGSRSTEHEVSVVTAMQVIRFLSERHDVVPIYITKSGSWVTGPKLATIDTYKAFEPEDSELRAIVITPDRGLQTILDPLPKGLLGKPRKLDLDVVFPVFHGVHGEDGTIQGLLELADLPYVGAGVLGSCVGIDKVVTKAVLRDNGIPVLDYMWFTRSDWEQDHQAIVNQALDLFSLPVIVKPARLGSSIGVQKASNQEDLEFAIDTAIHYDERILIEPSVENMQEINCAVLGNKNPIPSVCEQPVSRDALLSYRDKYLHDERERGMEGLDRIIPAPIEAELTKRIQQLAVQAFRCIGGLGLARVDFMIDQDTGNVYANELNTMPGSISFYLWEASGITPEQLVDRLLELALEAHREKQRTTYSIDTPLLQQADMLALNKG